MDLALALLEIITQFVHASEKANVFLDEEGFAIGVELLELSNDFIAAFFTPTKYQFSVGGKLGLRARAYLPTIYARGAVVRMNSSFAVLSPMPPVPPTNTQTRPLSCLPLALDSRMVLISTISILAP